MTPISSSITPATGAQNANGANAALNANFDMFLKLLTTQMQNQDPLDPMETSEYTQQLVQYSAVEQSIQQTSTLKDILASLSTQDLAQSANFLGTYAMFDSATAGMSATTPADWSWEASRAVETLSATITNASGQVVETRVLDAARAGNFRWDGSLSNGRTAPDGSYTLALTARAADGANVPVAIRSKGLIDQVETVGGVVRLGINGADFGVPDLIRVRSRADD
ncbi:flagellar hook assembly protein FlgD [Blastomonas aquatica]|uniref:Basal-body rod modification protein FlgD n=1 Tax=Blastomonas aquatica TaxID=1510276 RepID=A0ABQ1JTT4_9SPHN|nr:flagellar hook assembly protein FlgD [Blastomonas aquatica]GGB74379.1 flagellar hook assembly protein [Blastomonas aquatica]